MASGVSEGGIAKIKLDKQKETLWDCSYKYLTWKKSESRILTK